MTTTPEPDRVVERDGERVVVDQDGNELVLRTKKAARNSRTFHTPDPDAAEDGNKQVLCAYGRTSVRRANSTLIWRTRKQIEGTWSHCGHCQNDPDMVGDPGKQTGVSLAERVESSDELKAKLNAALESGGA